MCYKNSMTKFYITTAIPYVNAKPHIGHVLEFVQTDVVARYHRQKGQEVLLLSGSDENALKNVQAAEQAGVPVQQFIDENADFFKKLADALGVHFDVFQKGSDKKHHESSKRLWELCSKAGDIYKKAYEGLYCVGCEAFYTPEELNENQECLEHPGKKLEKISEENYFFRLSKYQPELIRLLEKDELKIIPTSRRNEVLAFLKQPLQDISISRSSERAKNWGVPVPGDDSQRMYVWFDALNIYQSGIGFGIDKERYKKWWPADVTEDGDFSYEKFEARYNADLASGLGNLVARVITLATRISNFQFPISNEFSNPQFSKLLQETRQKVDDALGKFEFTIALEDIWRVIQFCDKYIEINKPWEQPETKKEVIEDLLLAVSRIAGFLQPFLPETSEKIAQQLKQGNGQSLFPRLRGI